MSVHKQRLLCWQLYIWIATNMRRQDIKWLFPPNVKPSICGVAAAELDKSSSSRDRTSCLLPPLQCTKDKKKKWKQINTFLAQACRCRSPRATCGGGWRLDLFQVGVVPRAQGHSTLGTRLSHVFRVCWMNCASTKLLCCSTASGKPSQPGRALRKKFHSHVLEVINAKQLLTS